MKEMSPMLDPTDDYMTVVGTEEHMDMVATRRKKEMDEALSILRCILSYASSSLGLIRHLSSKPCFGCCKSLLDQTCNSSI